MFSSQESINQKDISDFASQLIVQNPHYKNLKIINNEKGLIAKLRNQAFIFRLQDDQLKVEKQINAIICNNETKSAVDQIVDFKKSIQKLYGYECFLEIYGYYWLDIKTESQRYFVIESEVYSFEDINYEDRNITLFMCSIQKLLNNQISDKILNKKLALQKNICYCEGYNNSTKVKLNILDPQFIEENEDDIKSTSGNVQKECQSKLKVELSRTFVVVSKFEEYFNNNYSDLSQQYSPIIDFLKQEIKNKNISYLKISTLNRQEIILKSLDQLHEKQVCQIFYLDDSLDLKKDQFQLLQEIACKNSNSDFQFGEGKKDEAACFFMVRLRNFKQIIFRLENSQQISQNIVDISKIINYLYDLYQINRFLKLRLKKNMNKIIEAIQHFIQTIAEKFKCFQFKKIQDPISIIWEDMILLNKLFNQPEEYTVQYFNSENRNKREIYYKSLSDCHQKINAAIVLENESNNVKINKKFEVQLQYQKLIKDESILNQIDILKTNLTDIHDSNKQFIQIYKCPNIKSLKLVYDSFDFQNEISINFNNIQINQNILSNLQDAPFWESLQSISIKQNKSKKLDTCSSVLLYAAIKNQLARLKCLKQLKIDITPYLTDLNEFLCLFLLQHKNDKSSIHINSLQKQQQNQHNQTNKLFEQEQQQQQQQSQQHLHQQPKNSLFSIDQNIQTKNIFQIQEQQQKQEVNINSSLFQNSVNNIFFQGQAQKNIFNQSKESNNIESLQTLNSLQLKNLEFFIQEKQTKQEYTQLPNLNTFESKPREKQNGSQINSSLFENKNKNVFKEPECKDNRRQKIKFSSICFDNDNIKKYKHEQQLKTVVKYNLRKQITNYSFKEDMFIFEYESEHFQQLGKLKVVSQIENSQQKILSFECDNREKLDCHLIMCKKLHFDLNLVENWQNFSIQSEVFQKIIGQSYKPGCCHHQYNLLIGQLYKQQQHLEHLCLSISICDYMIENNCFQLYFDTQLHNKLRSLVLNINNNYSTKYDLIDKFIFNQIKHLKNLNTLKLKIENVQFQYSTMKKLKRLVILTY